jgi:uncharacterized membrane protein YjjP (DUF1212 family)
MRLYVFALGSGLVCGSVAMLWGDDVSWFAFWVILVVGLLLACGAIAEEKRRG